MTIDVGLAAGICTLWQQEALFDYTIQVGDHEIPVHKAIMASVSDYFRVMLNGALLESTTNRVELKGQSVEAVSKLIKLIYTGDENIVKDSAMEIFGSAVYFQMAFVLQACIDSLVDRLSDKNCLEVLSLFVRYSCDDGVERVKTFLKSSYQSAVKYCKHEETPYEAVQIVTECWGKKEWNLFLFLKHWVNSDIENCKVHVNDLMSKVHFSLIDAEHLQSIMEMDLFTNTEEPWCNMVRKAVRYQSKTIHHKILDTSDQTETRGSAVHMVFSTNGKKEISLHVLENEVKWAEHKTVNAPTISHVVCSLEVNNFLIVCSQVEEHQQWNVFDPRTMKWSLGQMANKMPQIGFALVYHGNKLYALGGQLRLRSNLTFNYNYEAVTRSVEEYSFHTNTWQEVNRMPRPVMYPAACVYEHSIYVSGGWKGELHGRDKRPSRDVDCLDLATGTWIKKAPMSKALMQHKMHVMTLKRKKVIVIIDNKTDPNTRYDCVISYYQPATDQWSKYEPHFSQKVPYDIKWVSEMMLVKGNTVLFINVEQGNEDDNGYWDEDMLCEIEPDEIPRDEACVQWKFSKVKEIISEVHCLKHPDTGYSAFGAVLSM